MTENEKYLMWQLIAMAQHSTKKCKWTKGDSKKAKKILRQLGCGKTFYDLMELEMKEIMKAIKANNKIIAYIDEQNPKIQTLIEKYKLLPRYKIVEVITCPLCEGAKWIEKEEL